MPDEEMEFEWTSKEKKIFSNLRSDQKNARKSKTQIDRLITEWNDAYEGKIDKKTPSNRSKLVMKEIAKQIEWQKPNIIEPFVSTTNPIRLTGPDESRSRIMQKYANMHFTGDFDREVFMDQLADVLIREGTVWVETSWENSEETVIKRYKDISMDRLLAMGMQPTELEQNEDGTFDAEFHSVVTKVNQPFNEILRNENVYPDPTARTRKEMDWIIIRRYETVESLRATGDYNDELLDKLRSEQVDTNYSSLGNQRNRDDMDYGYDQQYQKANSKKIAIMKYYGLLDIDDSGVEVQAVVEWAEKQETNLRIEKNPLPFNEIPVDVENYSTRPYSIWGNSLAFFLGDSQKIKSGIMRGIMDNLSNANNGQTFALRGSMDYVNFKRWRNGERHILVNKHPSEALYEGNFNNLPPSIFNTLQMVDSEIEKLSGTQAGGPALGGLNKDDSDGMQMTMAQQRMASTVRGISGLLSKMVKKWIIMAEHWLDDEQIQMMFTESEVQDINAFRDSGKTQVKLKVGTEVSRTMATQQINMLLQQSATLQEQMPPDMLNALVAEQFELFDMYEKAEALRTYQPPPPSEQQMAMQQLEVEKLQLENGKIQAEIAELNSRAQNNMADAQATIMYKQAQTAEKMAKTQSHEVETALKPVAQMTEIQKVNKTGV